MKKPSNPIRSVVKWLILVSLVIGIESGIPMTGQALHAPEPLPAFEVATIKLADQAPGPRIEPAGSEQMMHTAGDAYALIAKAYEITSAGRVLAGPAWIEKNYYRITAKIPDALFVKMEKMSADERREQARLMMQSLLRDRFNLKVHFETRIMPIYELVVAKGGPKLPAPNVVPVVMGGGMVMAKGKMRFHNMTLDGMLYVPFTGLDGRLIVNHTGLEGRYDIVLDWTPNGAGVASPDGSETTVENGSSIFTVVEEQLGLKLVPTRGPVEVIVIDSIDLPSEN